MMSSESGHFINFVIFMIIAIYIASYFLPEHWGVKCTEKSAPMASLALCAIYIIWTVFTVKVIRADPLLATKEHSYGDLWETTK